MKKILLIIATLLLTVISFGQDHMTFKTVEINGPLWSMISKLEGVGFEYERLDEKSGVCYMTGKFAGYNTRIGVMYEGDIVFGVGASYSDGLDTWAELLKRFDLFEKMLTIRYGEPSVVKKEVKNSYDGRYSIRDGDGEWSVRWETDKGNVYLYIAITTGGFQTVVIGYTDRINSLARTDLIYGDL